MRQYTVLLAGFIAAWVAGFAGPALVFSDSECWLAYSWIVGWWCALYASRLFAIPARVGLGSFAIAFAYAAFGPILGWPPSRHDLPELTDLSYYLSAAFVAALVTSPILVDMVIREASRFWTNLGRS